MDTREMNNKMEDLKNQVDRVFDGADDLGKALSQMGISVFDQDGNSKPPVKVLDEISDYLKVATKEVGDVKVEFSIKRSKVNEIIKGRIKGLNNAIRWE